jgi:hypothetical protein
MRRVRECLMWLSSWCVILANRNQRLQEDRLPECKERFACILLLPDSKIVEVAILISDVQPFEFG